MKIFKNLLILTVLFFLLSLVYSCGKEGVPGNDGNNGRDGSGCSVKSTEETPNETTVSCDNGTSTILKNGANGATGAQGLPGKDGSNGKDYTPPPASFEGFWILPNGGYFEILKNSKGNFIIYGTQRIYTVNFDKGLALHPNLPAGPHIPKTGNLIFGEYKPNYSSLDVEKDGTTSDLNGSRKTVYKVSLTKARISVNIKIYNDAGLELEVNRTIESE